MKSWDQSSEVLDAGRCIHNVYLYLVLEALHTLHSTRNGCL